MSNYRLLTYRTPSGPRAGLLVDGRVHEVSEATGRQAYGTVQAILDDWAAAGPLLAASAAALQGTAGGVAVETVALLAPLPRPAALFCAGANYADHIKEMTDLSGLAPEPDPRTVGLKPWFFIKTPHTVAGPGETVRLPSYSKSVDWEAELVAVIGRPARDVTPETALEHVAGYTIANDLSARDASRRNPVPDTSPFKYDWLSHKCFEGSCPLGPWIVPAAAIRDPQDLAIRLSVNGVTKQDSTTRHMIFSVADQIAQLSTRLTLQPGDMVLTGTPAGVGAARREFLKPGDEVRIEIEAIGELVTHLA